ncbi:MAG: TonB-dependent receptor, partial [Bacteroidota bacterium]|nr:TonB-dependent receptor [Bacteroidota bacterium]
AVTVNGKIVNGENKEAVPAASVLIKGSSKGTYSDSRGNFRLTVNQPLPFTLIISSVGFETKEFQVESTSSVIEIELKSSSVIGTEVVVSATRSQIRSLESPVSIERLSSSAIREVPAPSFYDAIANLKGVDVVTSSILFKTMGTRGFNGSGNLRMNQLVDGMDNQAPGLNFSVGNIVGLNELDVDNVELLPGASSALYGSGGMTGTILMTSKDPFKYQGLSAQIKQGVNHISDPSMKAAPFYDWAARYAQAFDRFAFRVSAEYIQAKDWTATDYRNFSPLQGHPIAGDRTLPDYNGVNTYGDESAFFTVKNGLNQAAAQYAAAGDPVTAAQLGGIAALTPTNSGVTRTGYAENTLTDYKAYNFKGSAGLFYKISDNTTASISGNFGSASTIYTGTDRYSLQNVRIGQYKAEVAGKRFYVRAYTTQEDAGNSFDMVAASTLLNETYAPTATVWAPSYIGAYAAAFGGALGAGQTPAQAYVTASAAARAFADQRRFQPGTTQFNKSLDSLKKLAIPSGGKFNDQTNLYVGEGMYNFSDLIKWADITIGASTREFVLNSHGTIFADTAGTIKINETGAFAQIQKGFFNDLLRMTVAGRYDKNSNFKGRFTPRVTAVFEVAKDNFIRASFQTAYRFPSTQNQYINLQTGSARLIGGLPQFISYYGLNSNTYDTASLGNFQRTGQPPAQYQFKEFKPETVASWELGYKGLIAQRLFIDIYGFYAQYTNFIGLTVLVKDPLTQGQTARNTFGIYTNSSNKVNTVGAGLGLQYQLPEGFFVGGNIAYNDLSNNDANVLTQFNTPKIKFNISVGDYTISKVFGFNLTYRWQDSYVYESSFVSGTTPAFGALDAQISMKLPKLHNSMIKIGATNLLNKYYSDAIGNSQIGGLYYVSLGYNVF